MAKKTKKGQQEVKFLPGIQYSGAPEFAALWDEFTRNYTKGEPSGINVANMLNTLAFGGGVAEIVNTYRGENFSRVRCDIEHIAEAASLISENDRTRPLNREMERCLVSQWVLQEKAHGLYPPLSLAGADGVTNAQRQAIRKSRKELLATQEGGLLSGTLQMLENNTMEGYVNKVHKKFKRRVDRSDVVDKAETIFQNSLFGYEERHEAGAELHTYIQNGLEQYLEHKVRQLLMKKSAGVKDIEMISSTLTDIMPDNNTPDILANLYSDERSQNIAAAMENLNERWRDILKSRFGLNGEPQGLKEIAERYGIGVERVRQLEVKALKKFGANYAAITGEIVRDENAPKPRRELVIKKRPSRTVISKSEVNTDIPEDISEAYTSGVKVQVGAIAKKDKNFKEPAASIEDPSRSK